MTHGVHDETWTVWGNDSDPIAENLNESQAQAKLDELKKEGREDVYAENENGDLLD